MTDSILRTTHDPVQYLIEARRRGVLADEQIKLLAYVGYVPAQIVLPCPEQEHNWARGLAEFGPEVRQFACRVAQVASGRNIWPAPNEFERYLVYCQAWMLGNLQKLISQEIIKWVLDGSRS